MKAISNLTQIAAEDPLSLDPVALLFLSNYLSLSSAVNNRNVSTVTFPINSLMAGTLLDHKPKMAVPKLSSNLLLALMYSYCY